MMNPLARIVYDCKTLGVELETEVDILLEILFNEED